MADVCAVVIIPGGTPADLPASELSSQHEMRFTIVCHTEQKGMDT